MAKNRVTIDRMWAIGERLRDRREHAGMDGKEAAKAIGIGKSYLSMLETGASTPNWELLGSIAKLYNTSTDYLLGLTDDPRLTPTAPLPRYSEELLKVLGVLSDDRRVELLAHAQVLLEAEQRATNSQKLSIMLDIIQAVAGEGAVDAAIEIMELGVSDPAAAAVRMEEYFARNAGSPTSGRRRTRKDASHENGQQV